MSKKILLGLLAMSILLLTLNQPSRCETQTLTFQGWQVEDDGGFYSESNGVLRLWSNGGSDCPSISLYKQIEPKADFTFSLQVNAETAESCGIFIRPSLPMGGNRAGFNFEFGHYGQGLFLLVRNTSSPLNGQFGYGEPSYWTASQVAVGDPHVWYTMQLSVSSSPFVIKTCVFDENGTSLGSFSTSDIVNFTFEDINYIGLTVWGYSPSDYSFRSIQNPFDNPSSISISTLSSSINAGSAVNVFGTLTDSNNDPIQNETVVVSYTFEGANSWIPLSSDQTDAQGNYNIQWINSASGTFTLKTEWSGDATHSGASNTTTLSFMPLQNQRTFVFESNSTISALAFNNETSTLTFNVTGSSGTTGFVRAVIAKNSLANGENLIAQIDGKALNYSISSTDDSWVYYFSYSHSTHQISLNIGDKDVVEQPAGNLMVLVAIIAVFGVILMVLAYSFRRQ